MKRITLIIALSPFLMGAQKIITSDIDNFWIAYDHINVEKDSAKQVELIRTLYIDKGTPGLDGIMRARSYSAEEYVFAINNYPKFWRSVRSNTLRSGTFSAEIENGVDKLKMLYPDLKPVNIYFEIGVLRTGGTTIDGMLLIGSEVALADKSVITSEFDHRYPHLRVYFDSDPVNDVVFLNIHEYIHTQQKETIGTTLLSQTVIEGAAEFLAELALGIKSPNPQIEFGFKNEALIKSEFGKEMFSTNIYNWIMNDTNNRFKMRDLGYFVGYAICKRYYEMSHDPVTAVREMIELDYNNESELITFVERAKYFDKPLIEYKKAFEKQVPFVVDTSIKNYSTEIATGTTAITITFSEPLNGYHTGIDFGPLGADYFPELEPQRVWSADNKSITIKAKLKANRQYQMIIDSTFRKADGTRIRPYVLTFKTAAN